MFQHKKVFCSESIDLQGVVRVRVCVDVRVWRVR